MNIVDPAYTLKPEWIELIRSNAAKSEKDKRLTRKQLDLIYSQEWFRMLMPSVYGGKQKPVTEMLQVLESLAWADASMGWTVGLCATSGWNLAFMEPNVAAGLVTDEKSVLSACRAASGTAEETEGGYKVSGKWLHATGSVDATTIIGNCVVTRKGIPVKDDNNKDLVISVAFQRSEFTLLPTWKSLGMIATASDGFEVQHVFVSEDRVFRIGSQQKANGKLYQFPYLQLMEATLAVIVSGITLHFVDLCKDHFIVKSTPDGILLSDDRVVQGDLGRLMRKYDVAREKLFYGVSILWQSVVDSKPLYPSVLNKVSAATATLCQVAREVVNELYPYCGLMVTETDNEMNRVWRDFHTASQHNMLVFGANATAN